MPDDGVAQRCRVGTIVADLVHFQALWYAGTPFEHLDYFCYILTFSGEAGIFYFRAFHGEKFRRDFDLPCRRLKNRNSTEGIFGTEVYLTGKVLYGGNFKCISLRRVDFLSGRSFESETF